MKIKLPVREKNKNVKDLYDMLAVNVESPYEREGKMHVHCQIKNVVTLNASILAYLM